MKKISDLIECSFDIDIYGIVDDSRDVKNGYLFVATKGHNVDHFDYIDDAINNGAVCIIADRFIEKSIPVIVVSNINDLYVELCSRFYGINLESFRFIGVTGTDGKTTTSSVIYQLLNSVYNSSCIGTNGLILNDEYLPTNNTTPCVSELYRSLKIIEEANCKDVIMEVSSEALLHGRLKNFKYDIICFTNITEDHLNIHKTIENYRDTKFELIKLLKEDGVVVINGDDENCKLIRHENLYSIGFSSENDFVISDVNEMSDVVNFTIIYKGNNYNICSPLLGLYNVYNVGMAFAICLLKGISSSILIEKIAKLRVIPGRREYLNFGQVYDIILDYAHTYNGIKSILDSVSKYKNIITVTGAAGGREKEKRPKIGNLVLEKSDVVIFTMDDPRYENVDDIIDQMASKSNKKYLRIIDRVEAINKALSIATSDSVVLILGKGRDNYMAIEDRKEKYSDYDVIKQFFSH